MSSAATRRNARSEPVGGRGSRTRGTVREIKFKFLCDEYSEEIILDDNQTVKELKTRLEAKFNIPISKQFIYGEGWPDEDPADSVKIKDLEVTAVTTDVELFVASSGPIDDVIDLIQPESDADGARPGTSRSSQAPRLSSQRSESQTCQLHVMDHKNGEMYDEIPLEGNQSVLSVKNIFAGITGIPIGFQHWSGWPDSVTISADFEEESLLLQDIGLDKPYHSLVLRDVRDSDTSSATPTVSDAIIIDSNASISSSVTTATTPAVIKTESTSTSNVSRSSYTPACKVEPQEAAEHTDRIPDAPVPSSSASVTATARKSTTKGAARAALQKKNLQKIHSESEDNQENNYDDTSSQRDLNESFLTASSSSRTVTNNEDRKRTSKENSQESSPKKSRSSGGHSPSKSPRKQKITFPLTALPNKVVQKLFEYLDPPLILRLRLVCRATKSWVANDEIIGDSLIAEEKWKHVRLSVTGEHHRTFANVVHMNLPITRFVFVVRDEAFYSSLSEEIDTFRTFCSLRVKEVVLRKWFMFQNAEERKLFESFENLEQLTIDELVIPVTLAAPLPCPRTVGKLQVLKLNYEIVSPQDNMLIRPKCWDMTWSMLSDCHSLLYFRFPRVLERRVQSINNNFGIFTPLLDYISLRVSGGGVSLEYLDLKHFNNPESLYINRFVDVIRRCYKKDIKLKNVHSLVIQQVFDEDGSISDEKYRFCENIISLINYCPFVENAPLRNLEKLTVDVIPSVTDYVTLGRGYKDIFWPKLRTIKIKDSVQQNKTEVLWKNWQDVQEDLYGFSGVFDRGNVEYIKIDSPKLPYFLSEGRLAKKFYNLRRLEIVAWCSNDEVLDKRLHAIWKKVPLEELRIENCARLRDNSFTGEEDDDEDEDDDGPPFLKLKSTLKKLTLGLDRTEVTDRSLIKVFSKMKIKSFILKSTSPTMISEVGLLKLLNREFGQHIEYFPFHCWSSSRIASGRFERLAKQFNSYSNVS